MWSSLGDECRYDQVPSKQSIILVVCNGTNNYVNHFWANIWIILEDVKIKTNLFQIPMWSTCNQLEKWKGIK